MVVIIALILVISLVVIATTKLNIHPFLSLLFAAVVMGFVSGMDGGVIVRKLTEGFGKTLSSIGIIIAFGTIIGVYLEKSGGAMKIALSASAPWIREWTIAFSVRTWKSAISWTFYWRSFRI